MSDGRFTIGKVATEEITALRAATVPACAQGGQELIAGPLAEARFCGARAAPIACAP